MDISQPFSDRFSTFHKQAEDRIQEQFSNVENLSPAETQQIIRDLQIHQIELEMQCEEEREINLKILPLINDGKNKRDLIQSITGFLQEWSGCEAVGIRLYDGEDFPYFETRGFSSEFVEAERFLCSRDTNQQLIRDSQGNPLLECMCGNVLCRRFDPNLPFFSRNGSFWTNNSTELFTMASKTDLQSHPRNRCNGEGYESVALIPLRSGNEILGLLQINDRRKDRFTEKFINFLERVAVTIAIVLEQKIIQEERKEYEYRLRKYFELPLVGIAISSPEKIWIELNEKICEILGYSREELQQLTWADITHPEDVAENEEKFNLVLANKLNQYSLEKRFIRKDGSIVFTNVSAGGVRKPDGSVDYMVVMIEDITERKRTEEALKKNEQKFKSMTDYSPLAICMSSGIEQKAEYLNPTFTKLFGYTLEDVSDTALWWLLAYPDEKYRNQVAEEWQRRTGHAIRTHSEIEPMEVIITCKDGSKKNVSWGFISTGIQSWAFGLDLTERNQAENALRDSETKYRLLIDHSSELIWNLSAEGIFLYVSPSCKRITGYEPSSIIGTSFLLILHPEEISKGLYYLQNAVQTKESSQSKEYRVLHADGAWHWHIANSNPVVNSEGEFVSLVGVSRDVTENKRLEEQVIQSQKMDAIGHLVGGIAHHINNWLMGIIGNLSLAEKKVNEETKTYLKKAQMSSFRIGEIVKQLLAFSPKSQFELKPVDINSIVISVIPALQATFEQFIEIEFSASENLPRIHAEPAQLTATLNALLDNSHDAILNVRNSTYQRDRFFITIRTEFKQQSGVEQFVILSVSDNGIGMDKETQNKIFNPFFTTKKIGIGNSFGLACIYNIIKQHGGRIEFESILGEGTTFWIYFPVVKEPMYETNQLSIKEKSRDSGMILVIDDEMMVLELVKEFLEAWDYSVLLASSGQEGLDLFIRNQDHIDLVILDLSMPIMPGWEVLDRIHSIDPKAKVVISSGYSPEGIERETLIKNGASGFLNKPYSMDGFQQILRETLGK